MNKLEKLKGICVRGSEEHGAEIIEAFKDAGVTNPIRAKGFESDSYYRACFESEKPWISVESPNDNLTEITLDALKEIVYAVDWDCPPRYVKSKTTSIIVKFEKETKEKTFEGLVIVGDDCFQKGYIASSFGKIYFRHLTSSELSALEKELEVPKVIAGVDFREDLKNLSELGRTAGSFTIAGFGNNSDRHWGDGKDPIDRTIYQRLALLGFKKNKIQDDVYKELYGYHPFRMRKQLDTVTYFVWDKTEPDNELIHFVTNDAIMVSSTVDAVELTLTKLEKQS